MPHQLVTPHTIDELSRLIGTYGRIGRQVRVVGAGHSFTPLVQTDDVLISLEHNYLQSLDYFAQ